jgi:hypothetical protein
MQECKAQQQTRLSKIHCSVEREKATTILSLLEVDSKARAKRRSTYMHSRRAVDVYAGHVCITRPPAQAAQKNKSLLTEEGKIEVTVEMYLRDCYQKGFEVVDVVVWESDKGMCVEEGWLNATRWRGLS